MGSNRVTPEEFRPTTRYRYGSRGGEPLQAHNDASRAWRREMSAAAFPPAMRAALLALIGEGYKVREAAESLRLSVQQVYGWAAMDEEFSRQLDDATQAKCTCGGTGRTGVGRQRCDCPGARERRREESRRARRN